ncbi:hypothetical protein pb186bvf_012555 [Paramecium bursaria]
MKKNRLFKQDDFFDDEEDFVTSKGKGKGSKSQSQGPKRRSKKQQDDDFIPKPEQEESQHSDLDPSSQEEMKKSKAVKQVKSRKPKQQSRKQKDEQKVQREINDVEENIPDQLENGAQLEDRIQYAESVLPKFMLDENIKDSEGRPLDDPYYDKTTIHIPIQTYQKMSPMFRQYWNAKMKCYDAILFFRCGRWSNVMYKDAIIIAKTFNRMLGFWGKERPCITIYDSQMPLYTRVLIEKGYRIMVVEQLEKTELADKDEGEIAKREIVQIISRGTWQDDENYDSRNLMVITEQEINEGNENKTYQYGISVVDCTTNQFYIDSFQDDEISNNLRSLLYKVKPQEVILHNVRLQTEKMIKSICSPNIIWSKKDYKDLNELFEQLKQEFMEEEISTVKKNNQRQKRLIQEDDLIIPRRLNMEEKLETNINQGIYEDEVNQQIQQDDDDERILKLSKDYPQILMELEKQYIHEMKNNRNNQKGYSFYYCLQSFYILINYLRKILLSETVYRRGQVYMMDSYFQSKQTLFLDAQALESLEVFQVDLKTRITEEGSVYNYLNKCVTPFGKRLLKLWVQTPPQDSNLIKFRQESINDLINNIEVTDEFQKRLKSLPDIERQIVRCFNTIQSSRLKGTSLTGETFGAQRLKEMSGLLKNLRQASETVKIFDKYMGKLKSRRLIKLISTDGMFPDISKALQDLEKCLLIKDGVAYPTKGLSADYDKAEDQMNRVLDNLEQELNRWKQKLNCPKITYLHGRLRYQMEIPDEYFEGNRKPKELIIVSKRKGFQRFQTNYIEEQIFKLKQAEEEVSQQLIPFLNEYFIKFFIYRKELLQLVSCLAELDCLCSLAIVSSKLNQCCFPTILEPGPDDEQESLFVLEEGYHPCLISQRDEREWQSNTIRFDKGIDIMMLTGPNMSGKSTLLRLIGVTVIIAQLGCKIPAKSLTMVPVDRIFCRLGATDRILEGKSTFYIELEETKTILEHSTPRSLVIIDELGRGTSTYDGVAIASSVLAHLANTIRPMTLFATHYHILLDEFVIYKNIQQCVMKHYQKGDEVIFEYKLIKGRAEKSFAANVARIAGVPRVVYERAKEKELQITKEESNL